MEQNISQTIRLLTQTRFNDDIPISSGCMIYNYQTATIVDHAFTEDGDIVDETL